MCHQHSILLINVQNVCLTDGLASRVQDYLKTVRNFEMKTAFPGKQPAMYHSAQCVEQALHARTYCNYANVHVSADLDPHPYHFRVDPYEPNRVW